MTVDVSKVSVQYHDSHFVVFLADESMPEIGSYTPPLRGKILGDYLSSEAAHEALDTMRTIAALGGGSARLVIAKLPSGEGCVPLGERAANAQLIEAAPELLAALKGLLAVYVEAVTPTCVFSEAATAEHAARAAIGKAGG